MHILLRGPLKQAKILEHRLGLTRTSRDEETEISIFKVDEKKKSGRRALRELQELGGKPLKNLLLSFNNPSELQAPYKLSHKSIIHFN